jgi:anti-sigma-K factor RskA
MPEELHALVGPYALDALNDVEERDFEEHLALCQRCREDLAGLREAAASLAYAAVGPAPPPQLKERILDQARSERPNLTSLPRRRRNWTAPLAAAAAIAASAAIGLGIWGATRPTGSDPLAAVLAQPGAKLVPMSAGGGLAVAPNGDAVLALAVPRAPAGQTYEAWVIHSGKARPAGLFRGRGGTSIVEIARPVGSGAVVAVTLERAGGASHPTQKPLTQSGAVT